MEILKNNVKKHLGLLYITGVFIITIILSCRGFILNSNRNTLSFFISIIYLISWIYLMRKFSKNEEFFKISTVFWGLTFGATVIYYFIYALSYTGEGFSPIALIFLSPIYSIGEIIAPYSISKIYITMIIAFTMLFLNYKNLIDLEKDNIQNNE